jgi:hypothetical protein
MSADFSKIGRNNKNRGRRFERDVADLLTWQRVPYSGAMSEWGSADVVDGFYKKRGYWAAECKTDLKQPDEPLSINIQAKWVSQLIGGEYGGRHGILVVSRILSRAKPGTKRPPAFVFMLDDTWNWFTEQLLRKSSEKTTTKDEYYHPPTFRTKQIGVTTRGMKYNFGVEEKYLNEMRRTEIPGEFRALAVEVYNKNAKDETHWHVLRLDDFADIVKMWGIMIFDKKPDDNVTD